MVPQLQNRTTCTLNFWNRTRFIPGHGFDRFWCCPTPVLTVPTQICLPFPSPRTVFKFGYFFKYVNLLKFCVLFLNRRTFFPSSCIFSKMHMFFKVHLVFLSFNFLKLMHLSYLSTFLWKSSWIWKFYANLKKVRGYGLLLRKICGFQKLFQLETSTWISYKVHGL